MESIVIDRGMLSQTIFSYINSEKIRIFEDNGNIVLSPVKSPILSTESSDPIHELFGMYNDGRLSSEDFLKYRAVEERDN